MGLRSTLSTTAYVLSFLILCNEVNKAYKKLSQQEKKLTPLPPKSRGIESRIGNTPLIEIKSLSRKTGCKIYAKLELSNPAGSSKDRVALAIIRAAETQGLIRPYHGDVIFEGTSGSTGISFAVLCNALGYTAHICLPDDTSPEKLLLLESLGAEVEKVKPASIIDPNQYVNAAKRGAEAINNDPNDPRRAIFANQFENDFNWRIHYTTTGPEILKQFSDDEKGVDVFISGSGTGGTIAGVGRALKEYNEDTKIILADPQGSGLANRINYGVLYDSVEKEGTRRRHQVDTLVEGIGLNRLTWNFSKAIPYIDEAVKVTDEQALKMARYICLNDGLFWGSSSAINCVAAVQTALKYGPGQTIVLVACDSGERHMSKFHAAAIKHGLCELEDIIQDTD
ncbi:Putative mitochondrial cysteine synthase [Lodderomyces elongisporus]|uniref:Putative mitochondrial cysteine synthase n=1 Tax=Lodderomyces elongisporus TaxID=36914 RepID=UPI00291F044D|nr:Putative mitochondrial cysteine synthase [Lodderomyces elongisporus]WLF81722.1 Putative mitochondrial cysteine synthase [Lodderomyces elongisporus]